MSTEQVFNRFQELLLEKGVSKEKLLDIWNKNSFCMKYLSAGPRKGGMCNKKCVKNELHCRTHLKNDV